MSISTTHMGSSPKNMILLIQRGLWGKIIHDYLPYFAYLKYFINYFILLYFDLSIIDQKLFKGQYL